MPTVVSIPGVGDVTFPDNMSDADMEAEARRLAFGVTRQPVSASGQILPQVEAPERQRQQTTGAEAFGETMSNRLVDNLSEVPRVGGDILAGTAAALKTLPGTVSRFAQDKPLDLRNRFSQEFSEQQGLFPASTLRGVNLPDSADLMASGKALRGALASPFNGESGDVSGRFQRARADIMGDRRQLEDDHPFATMAGETAGDVATLLSGRAPIARARAPARRAQREALEQQAQSTFKNVPSGLKDELSDVLTANIVPFLRETGRLSKRAGGKAVETGLEGATLALLNDGDPEATFWFGAGGQAVGSASLFLVEKPVKRLLPFIGTAWAASEIFKAAAPGEQDFFESKDFAVQKVVAAYGLGLTAALSGAGRLRGPQAERFPALFDAITAAPRGAVLSRLQELTNNAQEGNEVPLQVMTRFSRQPNYFSENQRNVLGRALNSEKPGAFTREVERLMKTTDFRRRVEGL